MLNAQANFCRRRVLSLVLQGGSVSEDLEVGMELTSREIATLILFFSFVVIIIFFSRDRGNLWRLFCGVVKAIANWKIYAVVLAYLVYVFGIVALAYWLGFWSLRLLKDTIIIVLFTGFPIVINAINFKDGPAVVTHAIREVLGISALLVVYLNLAPFPLLGEVIFQSALIFLGLLAVVGKRNPRTASQSACLDCLGVVIVLGAVLYVTVQVVTNFNAFDWGHQASAFALSVWLPVAQIPFVYCFGLLASVEGVIVRMKFHNGKIEPPFRVRFALVVGLRGSLQYASGFTGLWLRRISIETSFLSARQVMREYRRVVRENHRANQERLRHLRKQSGVLGVDENGLWKDRREFHESKEALGRLFLAQAALYRNRGRRYWSNPAVVFPIGGFKDLPEDHGMQFHVRDDGQAWRAWRRTIGGFYLGVGGTNNLDAYWRYADTQPPVGYPEKTTEGWAEGSPTRMGNPEWEASDAPYPCS